MYFTERILEQAYEDTVHGNCSSSILTDNGKLETLPLLQCHCRHFDKSFKEIFLGGPIPTTLNQCKLHKLAGYHVNQVFKIEKKYLKNLLLRNCVADKAQTL